MVLNEILVVLLLKRFCCVLSTNKCTSSVSFGGVPFIGIYCVGDQDLSISTFGEEISVFMLVLLLLLLLVLLLLLLLLLVVLLLLLLVLLLLLLLVLSLLLLLL